MVKIKWSPLAIEDLREILHFISKNSPEFSNYFKVSILEKIEFLSRFPQMGRKVLEVDNRNKRELIFQNFTWSKITQKTSHFPHLLPQRAINLSSSSGITT
jgi:hypothetical protein